MSDEQQTPIGAPPSLALGGEMQESDFGEFLGVIITDAWTKGKAFEEGQEAPWQWHLAVRPTHQRDGREIRIGGETQAFHTYARYSEKANSTLGTQRKAMLGVFPEDMKLGEGQLTGKVAWWQRQDITFGKNERTGETLVAKQVLVPTAPANEEETARAIKAANDYGSPVPAQAVEPEANAAALTNAERDMVLALVHGKNKTELQFAVARDKNLSKEVKQGLLSGKLIDSLISCEYLTTGSDGRYLATELKGAA